MEHVKTIVNELTWHSPDGKFDATLTNGLITALNFCEPGKSSTECGKCLVSTDFKYLKQVHDSLGELFAFIESENKKMGYTFANDHETSI